MNKPNFDNALLVRKERYPDLLDTLNIGFFLIDEDDEFTILDVNKTLLRMTGLRREDIIGRTSPEFYGKAEYKRLIDTVTPLMVLDDYQFENFLPTASGESIPVLNNVHLNRNEEGRPVSRYVMITDIRAQKTIQEKLESTNQALINSLDNLEKEKKKLEAILFGIGDCVTIFDQDGKFLLSNPKGLKIRNKKKTPFLSLESGNEKQITRMAGKERLQFLGQIQEIRDQQGVTCAYIETLRDITPLIKLSEREKELTSIKREMGRIKIETEMIGVSMAMKKVFELILSCAEVDSNILILGETGAGKDRVAQAIHNQSARKNKPFVAINCAALPDSLLESELFGHVKGSFTGAVSNRSGLFQIANGGTLFLDEVGDLNINMQVKLLRILEEKKVRPVGSDKSYPIDVRVITATNRDLEGLINENLFRKDLYYRIAVIPLNLPPLRDRKEDIIPLAEYYLKKYQSKTSKSLRSIDLEVQQILLNYHWPGNIRELENVIEHCVAMGKGPLVTVDCLPIHILDKYQYQNLNKQPYRDSLGLDPVLENAEFTDKDSRVIFSDIEKTLILQELRRCNGNKTLAAKNLGIAKATIFRKIKKYNLV